MPIHPDFNNPTAETLDHLMEGFQLIGFDWRYLYVNAAVVKQSKYNSKEELLGFTMMEKYPGIGQSELFQVLRRCMTERIATSMENEFTFPDQSKGWFELRIEPVPKGLFILSLDIGERKKAEKEKRNYVSSLEEMIFMTSHRLRQPVTNILGFSNLLASSGPSPEEIQKIMDYLRQSAQSLDAFTRELTAFIHEQQIRAGK